MEKVEEDSRTVTASAGRELLGLCVGTAVAFAGFTMSGPLVPLQALALGASPGLIGLLMSVTAVGSLLVAVPAGAAVQRHGTRLPMVLACLLMAASSALPALSPTLGAIFVGLTLFEIGRILVIVGAQGHVANLGTGRDSGLDFGWYGSAAAIGQTIGPAAAGLLMDHLGYRPTWAVIAGLLALTGLGFTRLIGPGRFTSQEQNRVRYTRERLRRLLNVPAMVAILASFVVIFAMGARTTFFPIFMEELRYSATLIGAVLSLRALVSVSSRLIMRWFVRLCGGRFPALLVSMASLAVGVGLTPFCRDLASLAVLTVLVGIGTGFALPLSMATVADGVRPEDRGVAMGLRLSGNRLAQLVNPLLFGLLIQWFGMATAFWAGGLVLVAASLPILVWWRQGRLTAAPEGGAGGPTG